MKKIIIYSIGLWLLTSCYDDKSNYDYNDVNNVLVGLETTYNVRLEDTTLVIRPRISQTLLNKKDNLTFMWKHSTIGSAHASMGDTLSLADTVAVKINATDKMFAHFLRLSIKDHEADIPYTFETTVRVIRPYMGAWMVLHKQDGKTKIGAVEYADGIGTADNDAYYHNTGKNLVGNPLLLGVNNNLTVNYDPNGRSGNYYYNAFMVVTDDMEEAGIYFQTEQLTKKDSLLRMVYNEHQSSFNIEKTTMYAGDFNGVICLNNGQLYQGKDGSRLYKAKTHQLITGGTEVNITHAAKLGFYGMFYDNIARRFLYYNFYNGNTASSNSTGGYSFRPNSFWEISENKASLLNLPKRNVDADQPVNLNSIPDNQEVVYMGAGYQPTKATSGTSKNKIKCIALANAEDQNACYIYEFNINSLGAASSTDIKMLENYFKTNKPAALSSDSKFASSCNYNGIMFFTEGNVVYRYDYTTSGENNYSPIYQHTTGSNAKVMKFAHHQASGTSDTAILDYSGYGHEIYQSIGVVFDIGGGKSELVILNLSNIGNLEGSAQVYNEFGDIKDIVFL